MRAVTQILTKVARTPAKAVTVKIATRSYASEAPAKKTLLNGLHRELGAKMVPFAGWDMPVQYPLGVLKEHTHTREKAGVFDVSHMGQLKITGKDRYKFIERLTVADVVNLPVGAATLSVFTTEQGGIIDDTIITNKGDHVYVVVNAGCFDKDYAHIMSQLDLFKKQGHEVDIQVLSNDYSLLALQGPAAESILSKMTKDDVASLKFMTGKPIKLANADCYAQRSGYTGEDGYEIAIPNAVIEKVARQLLTFPEVAFIGLGARDSLRLEAGMCLYGHELNETITPKQAALSWVVAKRRREEGGFLGAETILKELKNEKPVTSLRVGLLLDGSPARENATVHDPASGKQIGHVTSGTFSPILKKAIAMGYVETPYSKAETPVHIQVRGKMVPSKVVKLPFVPSKYKK